MKILLPDLMTQSIPRSVFSGMSQDRKASGDLSMLRQSSTALLSYWYAARQEMYTIWLFTYSDLKTIVAPQTAFGILASLSASKFHMPCVEHSTLLIRLPLIAFWTWINLLPFSIDNQRQVEAIKEDTINKPWRPLPSRRLTAQKARKWMVVLYPVAILSSIYLGGIRQCLALLFLGIWYNDLGGADRNPVVRNFINGCGFLCYASGAMEVAYGGPISISAQSSLVRWLTVIGSVVFSTIHTQDMADQAGDSWRKRCTVPLAIGDGASRVTIALPMAFWSCFGPWYWSLHILAYLPQIGLGSMVVLRTLLLRKAADDKRTFQLWNLWLVSFYMLPLAQLVTP